MTVNQFLADVVVLLHAMYVAFVVFGMLAIVLGFWLRWKWVRNFWFRIIHFATIAVVVAQSLVGMICPLTTLENHLRARAGQSEYAGSFVGHWIHELLFFDAPAWAFTLGYCIFGSLVLVTLALAPPRWPWRTYTRIIHEDRRERT